MQWIDGAEFGASQNTDSHQYRLLLFQMALDNVMQCIAVHAHAAHRHRHQLLTAQTQQFNALAPGIMCGDRCQHAWHHEVGMGCEKITDTACFNSFRAQTSQVVLLVCR